MHNFTTTYAKTTEPKNIIWHREEGGEVGGVQSWPVLRGVVILLITAPVLHL